MCIRDRLNAGYDVVIVDNLYNASEKAVDRVKEITGKDLKFYQVDIRDREGLNVLSCWIGMVTSSLLI